MKLTNEMLEVLLSAEECIGDSCYNPHSYDGYHDISGASYRFPVTFRVGEGEDARLQKEKYFLEDYVDAENFESMHYRLGANHIYVGKGILRIMDLLEKRYGLDFNALETKWKQEHPEEDEDE